MPCFNYGRYLEDAVRSAQSQTFPVREIIVVDDGSTDATAEIAAALRGEIIYVHQQNAGLAAARNRGLDVATGTHIVFLDADDMLAPSFVEECFKALAATDAGYAYATMQLFEASVIRREAPPFDLADLKRRNYIAATVLMDRDRLGAERFDESFGAWEDWELFVRLAGLGVYGVAAPKAVFHYRKHHERDSMLDTVDRDPLAEPRALRRIQRRTPRLFTLRERASNEKRILRLLLLRRASSRLQKSS